MSRLALGRLLTDGGQDLVEYVRRIRRLLGVCAPATVQRRSSREEERDIMKNLFARFIKEEEGQDLIEYALLAALLAVALAAGITTLKGQIGTVFTNVGAALAS